MRGNAQNPLRTLVAENQPDPLVERAQAMAITSNPVSPHRSVDIHGKALRMTEEQIRQRNQEAIQALDEVATMGDEDEQRATLAALMTAIDEEPLSNRKRFR
jgi:hypothetical protein